MKNIFTFILLLISFVGFAQRAALKGKITDEKTGEPIPGVTVFLVGTTTGTVTDFDGNYRIDNIEPGTYTIQFSFVSYDTQKKENIALKAGQILDINIKLKEASVEIKDISVKAKRIENTDAAVITLQRKSAVLANGVSASEMAQTGASNAAGALRKVNGVSVQGGKYVYVRGLSDRYSKTVLNGADIPGLDPERNTVQMDLFPTNILDNIMVYKSFSPDLPADFTGGFIDIKTKNFPDQFTFSFSAKIAYNPQANLNRNFLSYQGGKTDFLGFDDGTRAIPVEASGNIPDRYENNEQLNQIGKSFNKIWFPKTQMSGLNQKYTISFGNRKNIGDKVLGFFAGASYAYDYNFFDDGFYGRYKLTDKNSPVLSREYETEQWQLGQGNAIWSLIGGLALKLNQSNDISLNIINNHSGQKTANSSYFIDYRDNEDLRQRRTLEFNSRNLFAVQLKGTHTNERLNINWIASYALAGQNEPDIRYLTNDVDVRNEDTVYFVNKSNYAYPRRFYRNMNENNYFTKVDFQMPAHFLNENSKIKFGLSNTYKYRTYRQKQILFSENLANVYSDMAHYFANDNIDAVNGVYIQASEKDDNKNSYNGILNIFAAYAMFDTYIANKIRLVAGARFESAYMETTDLLQNESADNQGVLNEKNILPSVNITYSVTKSMNIRAAYNKTLARPSFREKSGMSIENKTGDIIIGNPDLKQSTIDNYDLRWEQYLNSGEIISIGAFYKDFKDPIERSFNTEAINPEITWRNVKEGKMYGIEAELTKKLNFVSFLKNFKISTNFTYVYSEVSVDEKELNSKRYFDPNYPDKRVMFEQSPFIVNGTLSYKNQKGWNAGLSYTFNAEKLVIVNPTGVPDVYSKPTHDMYFNISKSFANNLSLLFEVKNIIDTRTVYYYSYNNQNYIYNDFGVGRTFALKLSYKF